MQSRFFTENEVNALCPHGIRLFYSNQSVNAYNNKILNEAEVKITSIAIDVYSGYNDATQLASLRQKLHKKSTIDTGGLPYNIIFVIDKYYIITTNIDVSDGLANGAVGKLVRVEQNENEEVTRVWLTFPDIKIGRKLRMKAAGYMQQHNITLNEVPINRRNSTISLNNNRTMIVKRSHFPLISGCSMTIHKSQGGTFDEIVYEYEKTHSVQLLYVALSRVTTIEKLYIVSKHKDSIFYHCRKEPSSTLLLKLEFKRLSLNPLITLESELIDFITNAPGLSLYTFNIQSLRAHNLDLIDRVAKHSNVLILSETWVHNDEHVAIPNFNCIVKYKRPSVRSGGVAIYQNADDTAHVLTTSRDIRVQKPLAFGVQIDEVGEVCACQCSTEHGQTMLLVAVYISPHQSVKNIIEFLYEKLLQYSSEAPILNLNLEKIPIILGGDFNVNFAAESSMQLIKFFKDKFNLSMTSDPVKSTTRQGATIDAVFSRYLHTVETRIFVSHFSYHKPLVTVIQEKNNKINQ